MTAPPLLDVRGLSKVFRKPRSWPELLLGRPQHSLRAVRDVSLALARGETLGLVGESGSGKTTLGRCIAGFFAPTTGEIRLEGRPVSGRHYDRRALARRIQMIFQDPYSSLNPRLTVGSALREVLGVHGLRSGRGAIEDRVDELLVTVGLPPSAKFGLPHAFSGGQRQRLSIARALAAEPEIIVADEPVSALDVSIQAQILNLFEDLKRRLGLAYLFIAHDLTVVHHISDRIAVMYLGEIVECASADTIFDAPKHPYTQALLSAIPEPDPSRRTDAVSLSGELPDPASPPPGCGFSTRCPIAVDDCRLAHPDLRNVRGTDVRCIRAG